MKFFSSVTAGDVVAAYRELLGRDPESEEAIRGYRGCKDAAHIRQIIMRSAEYAQRSSVLRPVAPTCVGFVGNCQVNGIAALVNAMQNQLEAVGFEVTEANIRALTTQSSTDVPWCRFDVIWAHPNVEFSAWLQKQPAAFQARVRPLPTIDTLGFHPDCVYAMHKGQFLDSPIGPYHSALVLWAHRQGFDAERTLALFCPEVFAHLGYFDYRTAGMSHLVNKGRDCGMPVASWLARWQTLGVWMHTINHPRLPVLADLALHCLGTLGVKGAPEAAWVVPDELANSPCWPVYPAVAQAHGLKTGGSYSFKGPRAPGVNGKPVKYLNLQEFVERSLAVYAGLAPGSVACDRLEAGVFMTLAATLPQLQGATAGAAVSGNPYKALPDHCFWRRAVERVDPGEVDPVVSARFHIEPEHKVATAGSCFAQHVARALVANGFNYLVTESGQHLPAEEREAGNYGVFTARFGNVYTARQLRQLQDMALGLAPQPENLEWQRDDGRWIDGLRPYIEPEGFENFQDVKHSRLKMLAATSDMLQGCDVLVFTLGLTEGWHRLTDGVVVPIAPGVAASSAPMQDFEFVNFSVDEVLTDMRTFLWTLKSVNKNVKVVLTVSPVPLMATYENRSVVSSTVLSKSILRTVAGMLEAEFDWVAYFASYEVITAGPNASHYFGEDRRSVTAEGVSHVMRLFMRHYAQRAGGAAHTTQADTEHLAVQSEVERATQAVGRVVCDEEHLDSPAV